MTFAERKEFDSLSTEIEQLSAEKAKLDRCFAGDEPCDDIASASARYSVLSELLDEKELRWLELSEKE